jgi:ankyrin repeat protein
MLNSGDTAWMIISSALVLLMTPGLAFFYGDGADYDGRTALHLAASEGHAHVVEHLIGQGVNLSPVDRWGGTPLSDARRNNQEAVITLLEAALEERRI